VRGAVVPDVRRAAVTTDAVLCGCSPASVCRRLGIPPAASRVSMSAVRGGLCIWRKKTSPQCGEVFLFSLLFVHQPGGGRA